MHDANYRKILSSLQAQCSKQEYCRSDVFRKAVEALEGDRVSASELVASLVEDKFVDDLRYATAFARDKAHLSGWGPAKISYLLSGKGIAKEDIRRALEEIDPDVLSRKMRSVLESKRKLLRGDPQEKLKLLKFALSRGYSYESVSQALDDILAGR